MKKYYFLIIVTLILGLVLSGCTFLSNVGQVPATDQSEVSSLTKSDIDVNCPAAPAVAGLLLEEAGIDNRWGTGRDGGNYIREVANHMGPETDFNGASKCDEDYKLEVAKFLNSLGAKVGAELFQADLESVVYEGTCNKFGTHLGDTMTLTFSNNVAIKYGDQDLAETYVYFENASCLGYNDNYMIYTAEVNQVTITVVGIFGGPRPEVGDFVIELNGIVDAVGNPVIVPDNGVVVEGIVTYPTTEWLGTFISKRYLLGVEQWSYDITIAKDCNDEFVWGEITLIDPYGIVIETNVEDVKENYAYWLQWGIEPNLAAVGTATYGGFKGNFMFLFGDSHIQMLLSNESYETAWDADSVWSSSERNYDIWSDDGGFWQ